MIRKLMAFYLLYLLPLFPLALQANQASGPQTKISQVRAIFPQFEATQVPNPDDAADDPAIWVHPTDPAQSKVMGSNKKGGLFIYNLQGEQIFHWGETPLNNIDIRYNFPFNGKKIDILVGSNKETNAIHVFRIEENGSQVWPISKAIVTGKITYGICLHKDLTNEKFYAFVTHKTGSIEQWHLKDNGKGEVEGKMVREMRVGSQSEGCVADDEYGKLYVAEEEVGLWKFDTAPEANPQGDLISSITDNNQLEPDLEGIALYATSKGQGYLLLSVQTRNQFAVYNRTGKNEYLFSFTVKGKDQGDQKVDEISHTDGIEVISTNLGSQFPLGVFLAQDDENFSPEGKAENQNFKLVPWQSIACSTEFPLMMDNTWNPRELTYRGERLDDSANKILKGKGKKGSRKMRRD